MTGKPKQSRTISWDIIHTQRNPGRVQIQEHQVPEWDEDSWIATTTRRIEKIAEDGVCGCLYLNPLYTVSSPCFSADFSRKARKCQANWYRRVDQVLVRKHRKRRERNLRFWKRQAAYTGILIIEGQPVPPHEWTVMEAKAT